MTEEIKRICQNCRQHKNNPSYCKYNKEYVGRKTEACVYFNFKKGAK